MNLYYTYPWYRTMRSDGSERHTQMLPHIYIEWGVTIAKGIWCSVIPWPVAHPERESRVGNRGKGPGPGLLSSKRDTSLVGLGEDMGSERERGGSLIPRSNVILRNIYVSPSPEPSNGTGLKSYTHAIVVCWVVVRPGRLVNPLLHAFFFKVKDNCFLSNFMGFFSYNSSKFSVFSVNSLFLVAVSSQQFSLWSHHYQRWSLGKIPASWVRQWDYPV